MLDVEASMSEPEEIEFISTIAHDAWLSPEGLGCVHESEQGAYNE